LHICATIYHFHDLFRIYVPLLSIDEYICATIHSLTLFCFFSKGGYFTVVDSYTSPQAVVKLVGEHMQNTLFFILFVHRLTELGVSRSKEI